MLGSSLFAMTAYQSEPTCNLYSFKIFQLAKILNKEIRSLEIGSSSEEPVNLYPYLYPP